MKGTKFAAVSVSALVAAAAVLSGCGSSSTASGKTGTYHGEAQGFGGIVSADVTFDNGKITDVVLTGDKETPTIGGAALDELKKQVLDAGSAEIDGVSGATHTSDAVKEAVQQAIDATEEGTSSTGNTAVTFKAGTYTGTSTGYNGPVELDVTFSDNGIDDIAVKSSKETAHVGDVAYDIMFADAKEAVGSGIDSVSGATFTSRAIKDALDDAAQQAGVSDLSAFQKNTVVHSAGDPIDETYDVVVIGAGGAGMAAAAQAVQNGD
ncbi:MAG: FMN-binding protein, partial [Galactobacillus timonensis]|nr:FMN-binding protein [Galactobacillus timonensis]